MLRTCILLIATLFFCSGPLSAQYGQDYGVHIGASNYLGEMGGKEKPRRDFIMDMKLPKTRYTIGGYYRKRFDPLLAATASLKYFRISGDDALSTNPARVGRNLSFRNDVFELTTRADFYFYHNPDVGNTGRYILALRGYIFAGGAAFYHNPQAQLDGEWHNLRPLKTEGQDQPYPKISFAIPNGAGFFFSYKNKYRFGFELSWRHTFTDYLDDVSTTYPDPEELDSELARKLSNRTDEVYAEDKDLPPRANYGPGQKRGDPNHTDSYVMANITVGFVIQSRSSFYDSKRSIFKKRSKLKRKVRTKF